MIPREQRRAATPFVTIGTLCVVAGGLVAAIVAHAPSEHATWAAAYLVLIAGVAQCALGAGQAMLSAKPPSIGTLAGEMIGWNLGNAAVIVGTVIGVTWITDAGGLLLAGTLALVVGATRGALRGWPVRGYRLLLLLLLISIPVGLVLGHVRAS